MQENTEEKQYYLVKFIYRHNVFYCIWYTNSVDGFVLKTQRLLYFDELTSLKTYCIENNINIYDENEVTEYNLDRLLDWIESQEVEVDCKFILDCWNIMSDISSSVHSDFIGDEEGMLDIYEKLFYGNNLPCINRSGKLFMPVWSMEEIQKIYKVMEQGMSIIENIL